MKLLTDEYIGAERFGIPLGEILAETGDVFDFRTHTHSYYEMTLYALSTAVFHNNGFCPDSLNDSHTHKPVGFPQHKGNRSSVRIH